MMPIFQERSNFNYTKSPIMTYRYRYAFLLNVLKYR